MRERCGVVRIRARRDRSRAEARNNPALVEALQKIGARVAKLRVELGLTQEDLANAAEIDVKHVGDIEHGKSNMTVATLLGLSRGLKVRAAKLLDDV